LAEHSNLLSDPIARFHNTFRVVFTMIFGTRDQALSASRHLHILHERVRGKMPEDVARYKRGSLYQANETEALRWVYATLIDSALLAYECVMPALSIEERTAYYEGSKTMAALFGIPHNALPKDWAAFSTYNNEMWESDALGVNELSRSMAHAILSGSGSWIRPPHWYRALTIAWMPLRFQKEFALDFRNTDQRTVSRARHWLPHIYRKLPPAIRFVGPYHEARRRLDNQPIHTLTRWSNHFWIGQSRLPFGD
jgi:uncharacterized protein (DUF2236 family)